MDAENLTIGISTFLSLVFGIVGALGVWYNLKGKVNSLQIELDNLKEKNKVAQDRISSVKEEVTKNRERNDDVFIKIQKEMHDMRVEILEKLSEINK